MFGFILFCSFGVAFRYLLSTSPVSAALHSRIELVTPSNSWKQILEGVHLYRSGVSPYSGNTFNGPPLLLSVFHYLLLNWEPFIPLFFAVCDALTAYFILSSVTIYLQKMILRQNKSLAEYSPDSKVLLVNSDDVRVLPRQAALCYLLNPFSILSCAAFTMTTIDNFLLGAVLFASLKGCKVTSLLLLALATYLNVYAVILIVPVLLALHFQNPVRPLSPVLVIQYLLLFLSFLFGFLYFSYGLMGSWEFVDHTYGFVLTLPDLTPSFGLFWYFFTEMFDHFRVFFLWVFQLNILVYVAPLSLRLKDDPGILFHQFLMLMAIFKSYPSVGDAAVYMALLPMFKHLYYYVRHSFVVGCSLIACTVLSVVMWHLWIDSGSANANFFFAITLLYSTAQIFLLTDLLYAHLRRNLHLKYGLKPEFDGKDAKVVLD